tara:strand:- start:476 stop:1390 length:915 start_codon:yes stop_codon:yes gene_type:complete
MNKIEAALYDSLMTPLNKIGDNWSLTGAAVAPTQVNWNYCGGIQDCAISPAILPSGKQKITIFTDKDIASPLVHQIDSEYKVAFLHECKQIHPFAYKMILLLEHQFDLIVTHDEDLLARGPKYVKISTGSTWISDDKAQIYDKNKLLSHIASDKNWAPGHQLRHIITKLIKDKFEVDFWGSAFKKFDKGDKYLCLKDYCFSITVMNAKNNNYFTETLIDAFRCGTVPIFWGCDNLGEYFNEKGVLRFNSPKELYGILEGLSFEKYKEMLPYVEENYRIAMSHTQLDDNVIQAIMSSISEGQTNA